MDTWTHGTQDLVRVMRGIDLLNVLCLWNPGLIPSPSFTRCSYDTGDWNITGSVPSSEQFATPLANPKANEVVGNNNNDDIIAENECLTSSEDSRSPLSIVNFYEGLARATKEMLDKKFVL
ncbi:hypothetical protein MMC25_005225 [Agyrium rufum]|nr:hypothetical protein [Agyrium rufum]